MNIVFMGTPDFAVESLERIYEDGHRVLAVVSQPDRKSGRGMNLVPTPVKIFAESKGIVVYQPEKIRKDLELIEKIRQLNPDVIVVVAFGQILPKSILEIPQYGCINVHGSLLPKYRGAAPIQWSVINGDCMTGITTMYMDEGMDTGDMIEKFELPIEEDDTYGTLYEKLKLLGGRAITSTLKKVAEGTATREAQSEGFTMAPMIKKEMGQIDWSKTSFEIRNHVRGFNPVPGAYTQIGEERVKVWKAEFLPADSSFWGVDAEPGTIIAKSAKEGLIVKTGDGALKLAEIQFPNKSKMRAEDFLRGHKIEEDKL